MKPYKQYQSAIHAGYKLNRCTYSNIVLESIYNYRVTGLYPLVASIIFTSIHFNLKVELLLCHEALYMQWQCTCSTRTVDTGMTKNIPPRLLLHLRLSGLLGRSPITSAKFLTNLHSCFNCYEVINR